MTFKKFIRWLSVILVYPMVFILIRQTQFFFNSTFFVFLGLVFLAFHTTGIFLMLRAKKREKILIQQGETSLREKHIELCIVAKNEGDHLIKVLKHYLT